MTSKRAYEGYIAYDHKDSPGIPPGVLAKQGLPMNMGRGLYESAIVTCNHCQVGVMLRPDRSRERHWCRSCDHYICDLCATELSSGGSCLPFSALVDMFQEAEATGKKIVLPERFR